MAGDSGGAPHVIAAARGKGGFGRAAGFLNEVAAARQEVREPAQHVLGPSHRGSYAQQAKPAHKEPDVSP